MRDVESKPGSFSEPAVMVPQYYAFISYSQKDKDVARKLCSAIENYRVPRNLAGKKNKQPTPQGPVLI